MSVVYQKKFISKPQDGFSQKLTETQDLFNKKHSTSIIGARGFEDILTSNALFEEYISSLTEGFEATEAANMSDMANSARETILSESLEGVAPYASLTMPILIKLWARLSLKYAIPTEPVTVPAFSVAFFKPYILDADGKTKHYLPECINMNNNGLAELYQLPLNAGTITPAGGTATPVAPGEVLLTAGKLENWDMYTGASVFGNTTIEDSAKWAVDKKVTITELIYRGLASDGTTPADVVLKRQIKLDLYRRFYEDITYTTYNATGDLVQVTDTFFGMVDLETGKLTLCSMSGLCTKAKVVAYLSSETHQYATNIDFDVDKRDIEIGVGQHIEASLPLEFLQDTKAMYQIDGASELIDIMSNTCGQKVDQKIYNALQQSYDGTDAQYRKTFNVYPSGAFAMNPSEWLNELRKLIDYMASSMRSDYKCYNGYFVIIGHPVDTNIIPNVTWSFNSVNDQQNGVEVQYSIGAVSGANKYTVVSSDLIPQGELTMFFVPTTDKFKTYTYYPYTFNVVKNYLNTVNQNVPSIMLTKRDTVEEFVPIIGKIIIKNNDGSVYDRV